MAAAEVSTPMVMDGQEVWEKGEGNFCGGGGGSCNVGKNHQNYCCYRSSGHGLVVVILL